MFWNKKKEESKKETLDEFTSRMSKLYPIASEYTFLGLKVTVTDYFKDKGDDMINLRWIDKTNRVERLGMELNKAKIFLKPVKKK